MAYFQFCNFLKDLVFPARCVNCRTEGSLLCPTCRACLPLAYAVCPFCGVVTFDGATCDRCKKRRRLDGNIAIYQYDHPAVKRIIQALKFDGLHDIIYPVLEDAWDRFHLFNANSESSIICFVPQTKASLYVRGYNQSEMLARALSRCTHIPVKKLLFITKRKDSQHEKTREERLRRMNNTIFAKPLAKRLTHAIVVDDIITTGATLEACARALKSQGVQTVWGFTIAQQLRKR